MRFCFRFWFILFHVLEIRRLQGEGFRIKGFKISDFGFWGPCVFSDLVQLVLLAASVT